MHTPKSLLTAAADLFDGHPERWIQGWYARDAEGHDVASCSPNATSWCIKGAFNHLLGDATEGPIFETAAQRCNTLNKTHVGIADWNDAPGRTHAEVVSMLRAAADL